MNEKEVSKLFKEVSRIIDENAYDISVNALNVQRREVVDENIFADFLSIVERDINDMRGVLERSMDIYLGNKEGNGENNER